MGPLDYIALGGWGVDLGDVGLYCNLRGGGGPCNRVDRPHALVPGLRRGGRTAPVQLFPL